MIEIQLVLINGRLVGRRFQDKWNLAQLEATSIPYTRNQAMLKKFRRFHPEFRFVTVRGEQTPITDAEREMFSTPYTRMVA